LPKRHTLPDPPQQRRDVRRQGAVGLDLLQSQRCARRPYHRLGFLSRLVDVQQVADVGLLPTFQPNARLLGVAGKNSGIPLSPVRSIPADSWLAFSKAPLLASQVDFRPAAQRSLGKTIPSLGGTHPLRLQSPVVDLHTDTCPGERAVLVFGPHRPPFQQKLVAVPLAGFHPP